jgi:hypothetical protein
MILKRMTIAALAALALMTVFTPAQAQETTMAGDWAGTLSVPNGMQIDLIFKVVEGEDGALSTTLDVPTQGAAGIACTETTVDAEGLHISGCEIPGSGGYDGTLNEEGGLTGNFNQAGQVLPLELALAADEDE